MSPLALSLVLVAALLHAGWNLVAKRAGGGNHFVLLGAVFVTVVWAPVALWMGAMAVGALGALEWAVLGASAVVHVLYFRCLLHGYSLSDLTVVYPVARGSGPLLTSLGAVVLLGERLTLVSAAGAAGVVCGVFLIAGGTSLWRQAHDPTQRPRVRRGMAWGAVTGGFIAGYRLIDA
ncbi:MAG TPA: EamA family transporter, partial [Burkholderiaceae bacterium]|nr:EamA family transporter [Burkholderiaceae bacterium]